MADLSEALDEALETSMEASGHGFRPVRHQASIKARGTFLLRLVRFLDNVDDNLSIEELRGAVRRLRPGRQEED